MNGNGAGSSYFHSLNVRFQKRFTNRLTFLYNFAYSKLISENNYLNDSDSAPEKRVGNDNRPIRNVLWGSYELPFGRGAHFNVGRLGNRIAGGWSFNGALTLQSGSQIGWGNMIYFGGPLNLDPHQPDGYAFDINQFDHTSTQQLANNIRWFNNQFGNLRRDMVKNLDLSLIKRVNISEQRYLQLRFETFNTTNRVTFGNPNTTANNTAFGTIGSQANTPRRVQIGARLVW